MLLSLLPPAKVEYNTQPQPSQHLCEPEEEDNTLRSSSNAPLPTLLLLTLNTTTNHEFGCCSFPSCHISLGVFFAHSTPNQLPCHPETLRECQQWLARWDLQLNSLEMRKLSIVERFPGPPRYDSRVNPRRQSQTDVWLTLCPGFGGNGPETKSQSQKRLVSPTHQS